ncbi:MAG: tetratricopeptide repeat protein [Acidobacteria bacterium]|nr:tetratricopeptide repeat protein [Acidobacteriota bacterium]
MPIKFFFRAAAAVSLVALFAVAASAQVQTATGKVTLKQADGTVMPVKDAVVDFFRTDINQKFTTKTNAKGEYVHAGLPFVGVYTIAVSAPGAHPDFLGSVKISQRPSNDFTLNPGDGSRLTLEQIKSAAVAKPSSGGAAAPAAVSAEDKKRAAEAAKEAERIAAENQKITELNTKLPDVIKAANAAYDAKKYDEAISLYDQGIQLDPNQTVFYRNKSLALRTRGVDKYNAATKAKDVAGKETAKADFKASVEASEKAVSTYAEHAKGAAAGAATPAVQVGNEQAQLLSIRAESYRVALSTATMVDTEAAAKAFQEYIAVETDTTKKMKAQADLGQALFQGGKVDEAIATYRQVLSTSPDNLDAIFGLGIALASDPAKTAEARDMLQQFANKAPATDPRKQMAEEAAVGLGEALKPKPAVKDTTTKRRKGQ